MRVCWCERWLSGGVRRGEKMKGKEGKEGRLGIGEVAEEVKERWKEGKNFA